MPMEGATSLDGFSIRRQTYNRLRYTSPAGYRPNLGPSSGTNECEYPADSHNIVFKPKTCSFMISEADTLLKILTQETCAYSKYTMYNFPD